MFLSRRGRGGGGGGGRGGASAGSGPAYIKISEEEIADDYPLPAQYAKEVGGGVIWIVLEFWNTMPGFTIVAVK